MDSKKCGRCKQIRDLDQFSKKRSAPDGLQNRCKLCDAAIRHGESVSIIPRTRQDTAITLAKRRATTDKWRKENPEYIKAFDQRRYLANKDDIETRAKKWYVDNKLKARGNRIKRFWPGSTSEEALAKYDAIAESQGHRCAICGRHRDQFDRDFDIDHNHATGEVRGLLCGSCNRALGLLKADSGPDFARLALEYITKSTPLSK